MLQHGIKMIFVYVGIPSERVLCSKTIDVNIYNTNTDCINAATDCSPPCA